MKIHRIKLMYYSPTGTTEKVVKSICKGIDNEYDGINFTRSETESKTLEIESTDLAVFAVTSNEQHVPILTVNTDTILGNVFA